jgi:flagellar basal-body rod protein FlgF
MSSGIYSTLSGSLARMQTLDSLANNMANVNTDGFKRDRLAFESVLNSASQNQNNQGLNFTRLQKSFTDFSPGSSQNTGNSQHLAIEGDGFFKVRRGDEFLYTRNGRFHLAPNGALLTDSGLEVVGGNNQPLLIPAGEFSIDENGRILADGAEAGQINIFAVDDVQTLIKEGNGLFSLPPNLKDHLAVNSKVMQGYLEGSNVNMLQEMMLMMESLRAFESHQKMINNYNKIGAKLDELGSL